MKLALIFAWLFALSAITSEANDFSIQENEIDVTTDFLTQELDVHKKDGLYAFEENMAIEVDFEAPKELKGKVPASLVTDFVARNASASRLPAFLAKNFPIFILTKKEEDEYFPQKGDLNKNWEQFYKDHPNCGGIFTLSHVGFSKDGQLAMIYLGNQFASLGGEGCVYVLKWNATTHHWKLTALKSMLWIS
jgi:hypothetical protein